MGRHLLCLFLAPAGAGAQRGAVQIHLHEEPLVMVRALLAGQPILEDLSTLPLDQLLEGGLVVLSLIRI